MSSDSRFQIWWNRCTHDPPGSGYDFYDPSLIAAVGTHVLVFSDGTATLPTSG